MNGKKFKKNFLIFVFIFCLLSAVCFGAYSLEQTGFVRISQGMDSPYTVQQVETMMKYHGALVAKFEDGKWFFLKDGAWIAIENGNALDFAQRAMNENIPPL